MQRLANAGTDHRKFMRMMPVYVRRGHAKKLYYAYIVSNLKDYFEDKLREYGAIILSCDLVINSNNNEPLYYYIIESEEGIIDPKWGGTFDKYSREIHDIL